jgi:hypothetical protein
MQEPPPFRTNPVRRGLLRLARIRGPQGSVRRLATRRIPSSCSETRGLRLGCPLALGLFSCDQSPRNCHTGSERLSVGLPQSVPFGSDVLNHAGRLAADV